MSRRRLPRYTADDEVEHRAHQAPDLGPLFTPLRLEPPSVPINTSEEAALRVMDKTHHLRERVYQFIHARHVHGATEREVEAGLDMEGHGSTIRPRLWELEGNVPAGRTQRPRRIVKSEQRRDGMRVYLTVFHAQQLAPMKDCAE